MSLLRIDCMTVFVLLSCAFPCLHAGLTLALLYAGTDATAFQTYVTNVYNLYKLPIYITEVASTSSDINSVTAFLKSVTAWCDQQNWIAGVFWFAASRTANTGNVVLSALMSSTGTRTPLGDVYCTK